MPYLQFGDLEFFGLGLGTVQESEVFLGSTKPFVADHMGEFDDGDARLELLDDKGVAEVIHLRAFNPRDAEVAIDGGADIANQEGITGLGDEEGGVLGFGALFDVFLDCGFGGRVEGDFTCLVRLISANFEVGFFERDILKLDPGQLADPETGL